MTGVHDDRPGVRGDRSELLIRLFRAALAAAEPAHCLPPSLPRVPPRGRTVVLGAGKAAAAMALAVVAHHRRHGLGAVTGTVVAPYGHGLRPGEQAPGIHVLEAGHPIPDAAGVAAGSRILALARACEPADRCIVLLSGGASALLVQPVAGVSLADKQATTRALLASGATIAEINTVRRKLSVIKGGGLARAIRAGEILLLAISDVPGDVLADIGSGPLSPDPATVTDARGILERRGIQLLPGVARALDDCAAREAARSSGISLPPVTAQIVASSRVAVAAAARAAEQAGWPAIVLPEVNGPAREAARVHAGVLRDLRCRGVRAVVLSGGESTVQVTAPGARGGRNGEYLLALALELGPGHGVDALAADSDGIDGTGDNAGALLTPDTLARGERAGADPAALLAGQQSYRFFATLDDLLVTGPTRTNVNDLRMALVP